MIKSCKSVLTGASGFLGREIIRQATSQGDQVVAYSRSPDQLYQERAHPEPFGAEMPVSGLDALVHLAGESILGFWTKARRDRILQSRIEGTRSVVEALRNAPDPPRALICASGINIYGDRGEEELVDESAIGEAGFLRDVAVAWETEALRAASFSVRVVTVRIAMVLGQQGALGFLCCRFFLQDWGGRLGQAINGRLGSILKILQTCFFMWRGRNRSRDRLMEFRQFRLKTDFTRVLGSALRRPTFCFVPSFILRMMLQDQAALLLDSQRALPKRALETGFHFRFPHLEDALQDLLKERRKP